MLPGPWLQNLMVYTRTPLSLGKSFINGGQPQLLLNCSEVCCPQACCWTFTRAGLPERQRQQRADGAGGRRLGRGPDMRGAGDRLPDGDGCPLRRRTGAAGLRPAQRAGGEGCPSLLSWVLESVDGKTRSKKPHGASYCRGRFLRTSLLMRNPLDISRLNTGSCCCTSFGASIADMSGY